jgi:hypothetical protein
MDTEELLVIAGVGVVAYFLYNSMATATPVVTTTTAPPTSGIVSTPANVFVTTTNLPQGTPGSPLPGGLTLPNYTGSLSNLSAVVPVTSAQNVANYLAYYNINPQTASYAQITAIYYGQVPPPA